MNAPEPTIDQMIAHQTLDYRVTSERCAGVVGQWFDGWRYQSVRCEAFGTERVEVGGSMYRVCRSCAHPIRQGRRSVDSGAGRRTYANPED